METTSYSMRILSPNAVRPGFEAGVDLAQKLGIALSLVVVDRGGHIVSVSRMDRASVLTFDVAFSKAWTAATTGMTTEAFRQIVFADSGAAASMPHVEKLSLITGGVPVILDGECIGGIGVSGATAKLDLDVAEAISRAMSGVLQAA